MINLKRESAEAFDVLSNPVWIFSPATLKILQANRAAQSWLGHDAEALARMTIADIRLRSEHERLKEAIRNFKGIAGDAGVWTIVKRSGDRVAASFHWHRVMLDGIEAIAASVRDVTQEIKISSESSELKEQVAALRKEITLSREHLAMLFDALPEKMLVLTPNDYRIVAATDAYAQSVMQKRQSLVGRRVFDIFPDDPADSEATGAVNLAVSLKRAETLGVTDVMPVQRYPIRRSGGEFEERFWLPRNKPILDENGVVVFIVHRVEDVTSVLKSGRNLDGIDADRDLLFREMSVTLAALQRQEARILTAEKLMDMGTWELRLGDGALSWSGKVFDIYGVRQDRRRTKFADYVALVHPDDRQTMLAKYGEFIQKELPHLEFQHRMIRPDGGVVHVRGVGVRQRVEDQDLVIGVVQDITRFVEIDQKLAKATRLQAMAGEIAKLGSWSFDLKENSIEWSAETAAIHEKPVGFSPSVEQGIEFYVPEHRERIRKAVSLCVENGAPFDEILQIVTAKGKKIWVRAIGEAVRADDGSVVALQGAFQDISDLIAARDAASALSIKLTQTLDHISDAFILLDDNWNFDFLNEKAEQLLMRDRRSLLSKNVWQEFPEAVGSKFELNYRFAVDHAETVQFQEFFDPLGKWFDVSAYPTPDGLAVYFRDITIQRANDEQLRLLEAAVARQTDILMITEAEPIDGPSGPKIIYVNDAFERRTGYAREEVLGRTPRILQGPNTQRSELDRIRRSLERWEPVRGELINYTKSGEEFWLELDIVPVADPTGWFTHWVAVERDVTERRRAEKALRDTEERFRLLARATNDVVWDWNLETDELWWNDNLRTVFGRSPEDVSRTSSAWSEFIHPEDKDRILGDVARFISGSESFWKDEYRFLHSDGRTLTVIDRAFTIRDAQGRATRMLGSMIDISQHRETEDRLRQAQKLEAVGQLTGGIAHDFNNLLTVILGNSEFLREELTDKPQLKQLAEMTLTAAARGAELTSRLLAFSRQQALSPKVIDLGVVVRNMETLLRRTLPESVVIVFPEVVGPLRAEVDPGQLETAILNLAINARDAMPRGGHITIEVMNAILDDEYGARERDVEPGHYVMVAVSDTGTGMPPEIIDRVFEPFFTTKEVGRGSGLGLSMVYGFVKQSGGHIKVYSEVGVGSTFKLYFPRVDAPAQDMESESRSKRVPRGRETILVVEDDPLVRKHVVSSLKNLGYDVLEAENGADALAQIEKNEMIDLIFTDVVMPGQMGGRDLAEAAKKRRPDLKVLFTSGYTENSIVHNGRLDSGVELLSKPYRRDQLATKVRKVLDS
ncbi:MAG: PAS domain S-box protein [Alphaproteobacteria bacterium]|nr:PAS domain S-box protein [Alphaproteobacteria bacterium]